MKDTSDKSDFEILRQKAEELLRKKSQAVSSLSEADNLKLIHELEVHQIELETLNNELIQAKERAEVAAKKYAELYHTAPTGYFSLSKEGKIIELNLTGASILGKESSLLKDSKFGSFVSQNTNPTFNDFLEKAFNSKARETCEVTLLTSGSTPVYLHLTGIVNESREQCLVTIVDITERKQVEKELELVSVRLGLAARAGGVGVWDYDIVNNILFWDDQMFALYGINRTDFIGVYEAWQNGLHPDDKERGDKEIQMAIRGEKEFDTEFRVVWSDSSIHNIRALAVVQLDDSAKALRMIGTNWDITELRKAEKEKLDDSESRYRSIFYGSPDGILIADEQTKMIIYANSAQCRLLGYTENELKTMTIAGIHPKDTLHETLAEFERIALGDKNLSESIQCIRKNGEIFYADIASSFMTINGRKCVIGFFRDITQRKQAENVLKEALVKAESGDRLKTAFLQNISHEVRTPLNGILGFGNLLAEPHLTSEEKHNYTRFLKASSDRLVNTITDYIDISLIVTGNVEVSLKAVNATKVLKELQTIFQYDCDAKNITLRLVSPKDQEHFTLITDPELLKKSISCLMNNAIKFTDHGTVTMGYSIKSHAAEFFVIDTGIGIAKEAQEKIFEPFIHENMSETRAYEGSGLGLPILKGFLKLLGGEIRLESEKGKGAAFFFSLPMEQGTTEENEPIDPLIGNTEIIRPVILVAEDDLYSDFYMEVLLKSFASIVFKAANGKEAVEMCRLHPEISLVLMDVKMPVMDGLEATRQIKSFRKDLPVIAITAYALSRDKKIAIDAGCDDFLSKPVSKKELLEKLKKHGFVV